MGQESSKNIDKFLNRGHRERLRERFLRVGFEGFAAHEVVELILTLSIPRKDVKVIAKMLLKEFGSLRGIMDGSVDDLTKINGVGRSTATAFAIIRSVNSLYLGEKMEGGEVFDSLEKVAEMWRSRLTSLKFEVVEIALLDSSLRLMKDGIRRLETGTACATAFYPRKIVESVIRSNATAVIIAHNHPGGSAVPSVNDERSTKIIQNALQSIDARLVDHLIIAQDSTFSFRENGLL